MQLDVLIARYVAGALPPTELPSVAEQLILDGLDSESLTHLMLDHNPSNERRQALFERSISELGLSLPDKRDAAIVAAKHIAQSILDGTTSPYDGATYCWKVIRRDFDRVPSELWAFRSNASAIEDCYADSEQFGTNHQVLIAQCTEEILEACRSLLAL